MRSRASIDGLAAQPGGSHTAVNHDRANLRFSRSSPLGSRIPSDLRLAYNRHQAHRTEQIDGYRAAPYGSVTATIGP
jgi:hypothetical protein